MCMLVPSPRCAGQAALGMPEREGAVWESKGQRPCGNNNLHQRKINGIAVDVGTVIITGQSCTHASCWRGSAGTPDTAAPAGGVAFMDVILGSQTSGGRVWFSQSPLLVTTVCQATCP